MNENDARPADEYMVGGDHYKKVEGEGHWTRMWRLFGPGYFVGCATKYLERHLDKGGVQDLEKSRHYVDKLIELERAAANGKGPQPGRSPPVLGDVRFGAPPDGLVDVAAVDRAAKEAAGKSKPRDVPAACGSEYDGQYCGLPAGHPGPCSFRRRPAPAPCDHDYDTFPTRTGSKTVCVKCNEEKPAAVSFPYGGQCPVETRPVD